MAKIIDRDGSLRFIDDQDRERMTLSGGGVLTTSVGPVNSLQYIARSGDSTGATDTAVIQAAIDAAFTAGGGIVQLLSAPTATPFWITQLKMRRGVTLAGMGILSTVLRCPLAQVTLTHMIVLNDAVNDCQLEVRDLWLDGNNGISAQHTITWGAQAAQFDGINFTGTQGSGSDLNKLLSPVYGDVLCRVTNVIVTNIPRDGISMQANASCHIDRVRCYWTGRHGFSIGTYDSIISGCISGQAGTTIGTATLGVISGFYIAAYNQITNCKAWWPGTKVIDGSPVTFSAPVGNGFHFHDDNNGSKSTLGGTLATGLWAQDCGIGFQVFQSSPPIPSLNLKLQGHASKCAYGLSLNNVDNVDMDVFVDNRGGNSSVVPLYAFSGASGVTSKNSSVRVRFDSAMSFSSSPAMCDTNGVAFKGCEVSIQCAASQQVAYAASITPTPYYGPIHYVGTLTGALTVNATANSATSMPYDGQILEFHFTQDSTGRVITFNAQYILAGATAVPSTASSTTVIRFSWDSAVAKWREISRSTT